MSPEAWTDERLESFDGVALRTRHHGLRTDKPVLVLVPPLATTPAFLQRAADHLATHFAVVSWEPRLFLQSDEVLPDASMLTLDALVRDLECVVDRLALKRINLVGYCSGASAALHMAAASDRVDRIALVNGAYFLSPADCELTAYERDTYELAPLIASGRPQATAIFDMLSRQGVRQQNRHHEFEADIQQTYAHPESLYRFGLGLNELLCSDVKRAATRTNAPTLVLSSEPDAITHWSSSALIASLIPDSETAIAPVGDHYEFCRAEPALLGRLDTFFGRG